MASDLRAQAEQLAGGHDWMVDAIESALRGVRDAERQRAAKIARAYGDSRDDGWAVAVKIAEAIESGANHAD